MKTVNNCSWDEVKHVKWIPVFIYKNNKNILKTPTT